MRSIKLAKGCAQLRLQDAVHCCPARIVQRVAACGRVAVLDLHSAVCVCACVCVGGGGGGSSVRCRGKLCAQGKCCRADHSCSW